MEWKRFLANNTSSDRNRGQAKDTAFKPSRDFYQRDFEQRFGSALQKLGQACRVYRQYAYADYNRDVGDHSWYAKDWAPSMQGINEFAHNYLQNIKAGRFDRWLESSLRGMKGYFIEFFESANIRSMEDLTEARKDSQWTQQIETLDAYMRVIQLLPAMKEHPFVDYDGKLKEAKKLAALQDDVNEPPGRKPTASTDFLDSLLVNPHNWRPVSGGISF